jgi:hypothetical protein
VRGSSVTWEWTSTLPHRRARRRRPGTAGSRSPAISVSIIARAEMVVSAEATESILIPLSLEVRICHGVLGDVWVVMTVVSWSRVWMLSLR